MPKQRPKKLSRLGELETEVMGVVWERGKATVQEVKDALEPRRSLAYTTVMTVMSRLAKKGVLERRKEGRAYYYTAAASQEKVAGSLLQSLVRRLYAGATGKAIAQLLETEKNVDDAELERLEALIRSKREARRP
jgi:BlaI family penicillinase repressor